jgi:hypothetical protein
MPDEVRWEPAALVGRGGPPPIVGEAIVRGVHRFVYAAPVRLITH